MGIGPIVGILPITMIKPSSSAPDLSGVFAVEFRGQQRDEADSPGHQRASRGLEDEESEQEPLVEGDEESPENFSFDSQQKSAPHRKVSFFA